MYVHVYVHVVHCTCMMAHIVFFYYICTLFPLLFFFIYLATSGDLLTTEDRDVLTSTPILLKESREDNSSLLQEISTSLSLEFKGDHTVGNGELMVNNGEHMVDNGETMVDDRETTVDNKDDYIEKDGLSRATSISKAFDNSVIDQNLSGRSRTDSYMIATTSDPIGTFRRQNLLRKDSYNTATGSGCLIDSIELNHSPRGTSPVPTTPTSPHTQEYELKRLRINNILDHEKANNKYVFPLVGLVPASVLHNFECKTSSNMRPSSSTSDYGSSGPIMDDIPTSKPPIVTPTTPTTTFNGHVKEPSYDDTMLTGSSEFTHSQDDGEMFVTSMEGDVANYPIPDGNKELQPPRKHSDRSMSLPTASLFPMDFTPDDVSEVHACTCMYMYMYELHLAH